MLVDQSVRHASFPAATRQLPLSPAACFGQRPVALPLCIYFSVLFGIHGSLFFPLSLFPLWPYSAAQAICAKANREQRDGGRAGGRKETQEENMVRRKKPRRMKEGLLTF